MKRYLWKYLYDIMILKCLYLPFIPIIWKVIKKVNPYMVLSLFEGHDCYYGDHMEKISSMYSQG